MSIIRTRRIRLSVPASTGIMPLVLGMVLMLFVLLPQQPLRAGNDPLAPWRYLQALHALRDKVAEGDEAAWRAQARLNRGMARLLAAMPDEAWQHPLNAQALLAWVLGGGNPALAKRLLRRKVEVALPEGALAGAVDYVEGRNAAAWRRLRNIDDRALGVVARAQLLLVRATLQAPGNPREALRMLAWVRLLKPGSLLEEAALRRAVHLAGTHADIDTFVQLAAAYMRRYPRSRFRKDFLRRLSVFLVQLDDVPGKRPFERLLPFIDRLPKRSRALLLAAITRQALISGKRDLALLAGSRALMQNIRAPAYMARVRTWMAAAQVVSPRPQAAMRLLQQVDRRLLGRSDRRLRAAALLVGEAILREPDERLLQQQQDRFGKPGTSDEGDDLPVLVQARRVAAEVKKELGRIPGEEP